MLIFTPYGLNNNALPSFRSKEITEYHVHLP